MKKIKELLKKLDSADKIMTLFSIVMLVIVTSCCAGCNAQPNTNNIKESYFDASGEHFDVERGIPFYADGVIDFLYCTQDGEFIIEYADDDIFDYDNLPKTLTCCPDDEEIKYITIFCSEEIFFDYLNWYSSIDRHHEEFYAASDKYVIVEEWFENEDTGYFYFKLKEK